MVVEEAAASPAGAGSAEADLGLAAVAASRQDEEAFRKVEAEELAPRVQEDRRLSYARSKD